MQVAHHDAIGAGAAHAERVEAARQPQHLQRHPARSECLQPRTRRLDHVQPRAALRERHPEGPAELARRMALAAEEAAQRVRRLQRVECLGNEKRCARSGHRREEGLGMHLGCMSGGPRVPHAHMRTCTHAHVHTRTRAHAHTCTRLRWPATLALFTPATTCLLLTTTHITTDCTVHYRPRLALALALTLTLTGHAPSSSSSRRTRRAAPRRAAQPGPSGC